MDQTLSFGCVWNQRRLKLAQEPVDSHSSNEKHESDGLGARRNVVQIANLGVPSGLRTKKTSRAK